MSQAVKVGIFMVAALGLLAWLVMRVEDWSPWREAGRRVDAVFDSVEGLDDKAAVRVAGVRVGRVDGIALDGRRARVTLLLDSGVPLAEGAQATIASLGLLGDKFVQLDPGPAGGPPLAEGAASVCSVHDAHADFVWRSLQRLGVRDADLEDMIQEVFIVVHRRLDAFDASSHLTSWLFGICVRVAAAYGAGGFRRCSRYHARERAAGRRSRASGLERRRNRARARTRIARSGAGRGSALRQRRAVSRACASRHGCGEFPLRRISTDAARR